MDRAGPFWSICNKLDCQSLGGTAKQPDRLIVGQDGRGGSPDEIRDGWRADRGRAEAAKRHDREGSGGCGMGKDNGETTVPNRDLARLKPNRLDAHPPRLATEQELCLPPHKAASPKGPGGPL